MRIQRIVSRLLSAALVLLGAVSTVPAPTTDDETKTFWLPKMDNDGSTVRAQERVERGGRSPRGGKPTGGDQVTATVDPFVFRLTIACGRGRVSSAGGSDDAGACREAFTGCRYRGTASEQAMYVLWQRPRTDPGAAWLFVGLVCRGDTLPAEVAVPAVPSMAQIRAAFLRLPFAKPVVRVQPVGGVTLVNLPTYYEATWPGDARLAPGEVSMPVKLLSWTVQFEVSVKDYRYRWGDGASSEVTTDPGGPYPTGRVVHTYDRALARAPVAVDARLTGRFRANGGEWVDLDAVADLQDEPVTMLAVKEARARLVGP